LPFRNCAPVHVEATVVSSLMVILAGGFVPSTESRVIAPLSPAPLSEAALPPVATT
jgi:hypothetical protein